METQQRYEEAIRTAKAAADLEDCRPGRRERGPLHVTGGRERDGRWVMLNAAGAEVGSFAIRAKP